MEKKFLLKFIYLSIGAAVLTITLKTLAYVLTGSVGLLSDAMESIINLVAALIALFALKLSQKPPDEGHHFGHSKAEYFSSIIEGILIFIAAISIGYTAIDRIIHPRLIDQAFLGIAISILASLVNLVVGLLLIKNGKKHHSITLEADGQHLMTDVWTSAGVIAGVGIVAITGIEILDPIVALMVAANIVYTGFDLIKKSAAGFMDIAIPKEDYEKVVSILKKYCKDSITYHALRTRQSGARKFVYVQIQVPGKWTVQQGHDLAEKIEDEIRANVYNSTVFTHFEPIEDPRSHKDLNLDIA